MPEPKRPSDDLMLAAFLAARDAPCPLCGYNLRGLTCAVCPECAEPLRLQVGLVEPRSGLFVMGTIGLSSGLGFCGFVGVWGLLRAPGIAELIPLAIGFGILGLALLAWWKRRACVRHLSGSARVALGALCWLLSIAVVCWFIATVS